MAFPETEYGKVLLSVLQRELERREGNYDLHAKISSDPLRDDFRVKMGEIINLKWVIGLPEKCRGG
jgi:hypothetical protein